jgi:hypothetical protein
MAAAALAVFAAALAVYVRTAYPYISGGDSGEVSLRASAAPDPR